ncbi:MAG: hypothetical protein OEX05_03275 [Chloroflexota bacterium]|jgi:hypothetical protein|nr:hypothetical protein [Chloroflexota bacterium]
MATTDAKPGFRLPWSSDRSEAANAAAVPTDAADATPPTPDQEHETTDMIDAAPATSAQDTAGEPPVMSGTLPAAQPPTAITAPAAGLAEAARKPNKFMADLTKAMQATADAAREETLTRLSAEAKAHIEEIHAESAGEAVELRKQADDDVAGIREWSKAEIARIREETDERISHRKARLDRELEGHAGEIEARIERVQARVDAFEAQMAAFFERLMAEEDPTRFATMAENLPEPPSFDPDGPAIGWSAAPSDAEPVSSEPAAVGEQVAEMSSEPAAEVEQVASTGTWAVPTVEVAPDSPAEATAETFTPDPAWGADPAWGQAPETQDSDVASHHDGPASAADAAAPEGDPRLAALGLTTDFAAAEAEAASFSATDDGSEETVPEIAEEAIAARLSGIMPEEDAPGSDVSTTRVVVTGLISVASIAGFKRHLSRVAGVQSVGVSSGPDGEFVFAVNHGSDVAVRDVIPTLPGFHARVTADNDDELTVAARDPEAEG